MARELLNEEFWAIKDALSALNEPHLRFETGNSYVRIGEDGKPIGDLSGPARKIRLSLVYETASTLIGVHSFYSDVRESPDIRYYSRNCQEIAFDKLPKGRGRSAIDCALTAMDAVLARIPKG